jgi:hypothetical protein
MERRTEYQFLERQAVMIVATILAFALLQNPAPTPVQRPAEITISVDEYARLKACESREIQAKAAKKKPAAIHPIQLLIVAAAIVGIVAISKRNKTGTSP